MTVIEHLQNAKETLFSYEIVPPPRGRSIKDVIDVVEKLAPLRPPWIDVTSHSSTAYYQERQDGTIQKRVLKKRPGTLGICGVIQNRFRIDTVAHMLCLGFSREETEDALIELNYMGIQNVLALRGDAPNFQKQIRSDRTVNQYATDLVKQIVDLKDGQFLDEISNANEFNFCVGVAGYPEKHFEAPSMKQDLLNLKKKVDAGADYVITQMFFDNQKYFDFVSKAREIGITVPIIPGLKVLKSVNQLKTLPKSFYIDLPDEFVDEVAKNPQHSSTLGKAWAEKQVEGLLNAGVPDIHFYVLNDVELVADIVKKFQG